MTRAIAIACLVIALAGFALMLERERRHFHELRDIVFAAEQQHERERSQQSAQISSLSSGLSNAREELHALTEQARMLSPADGGNARLDFRRFVIRSQLRQARSPIIFVGDSITESALLPSHLCEHPVVNAGIGGLGAANYADIAPELFNDRAFMIVVAIGVNDANKLSGTDFETSYVRLLDFLQSRTDQMVLAGIGRVDPALPLGPYFDLRKLNAINASIQRIAAERNLPFANLNAVTLPTDDGVHLLPSGYANWLRSIVSAVNSVCEIDR